MFHKIIIVGRLGADPEQKYTTDGKAVTTFSVAASNRKDETTWFRVTVFGQQAETCNQYLHKGSKVLVEGRLKPEINVYQRKDGSYAASYDVTADTVRFLSGKDEQPANDEVPF